MPQPVPPDSARVADSLRAVADSLRGASDSLAAQVDSLRDSTSVLQQAAEEMGDASELLVTGRWDQFAARAYDSGAHMLAAFVPNLVKASVVFLLLLGAYKLTRSLLDRVLSSTERFDEGVRNLLLRSFRIFAVVTMLVMVLAQFGIDITLLVGGLSIVGLAVGFAAKDTLENFISGIAILLDRPFRVGDQVEVAGTYGTVVDISLRSTRLRTLDNEIMVMPNLQMVNQKLVNHAMLGAVRVRVPFGIGYRESPEQARRVLLPLLHADDRIAADPPPSAVVTALGASSVDMELRFFLVDPAIEIPIEFEYMERIHATLRQHDIEIPFPQLDVHLVHARAAPEDAPAASASFDPSEAATPLVEVEGARPRREVAELTERIEEQGIDPLRGDERLPDAGA